VLKQLEEIDAEVEHLSTNVCDDDNGVLPVPDTTGSINSPEPKKKDQKFVTTKNDQKSECSKPNIFIEESSEEQALGCFKT